MLKITAFLMLLWGSPSAFAGGIEFPSNILNAGAIISDGDLVVSSDSVVKATLSSLGSLTLSGGITASSGTFPGDISGSNFITGAGSLNSTINGLINTSTSAILSGFTTTATSGFGCVSGSTITLTTSYARPFFITFDGTMVNSNGGSVRLTPVIGGSAPVMPGTLHNYKEIDTAPATNFNPSFMFFTPVMPAGTYSFCVAIWASGGTTSMPVNYPCQFGVKAF